MGYVRNRVAGKKQKKVEAQPTTNRSRKQVHLSSAADSLQGLTVLALRFTPGWPDGVTESRWDSEADKHPTLHQLAVFILLTLHLFGASSR